MAQDPHGDTWERMKQDPNIRRAMELLGQLRDHASHKARQWQKSRPIDAAPVREETNRPALPRLYSRTAGKTAGAVLKIVLGWLFGVLTLLQSIAGLVLLLAGKGALLLISMLCLLAGSVGLVVSGVRTLKLVSRFKRYCRVLGQKTHYALEQLARAVGLPEPYVRKDVQKMIGQGLFLEGHLDQEGATLITSHDTYRHFEESRKRFEQQQRLEAEEKQRAEQEAAARKAAEAQKAAGRDPRVSAVLAQGEAYLARIRACNAAIPGEEISRKISHMELIVQRIFIRLESDPEVVDDLKKLMDYYLPMTVKLLQTYADMDAQPIAGETIAASKREIEETLDTLNLAFEKLLDSIFQETALDVSSDISVLQTLLAQEGLTEDPLTQIQNQTQCP